MVNVLVMLYKCANQVSGESVMCTVDLPAWSSGGLSLKCVNECFEKGEMSNSQKQAVITLIENQRKL